MKSESFFGMLLLIGSNGVLLTESKGETCAKNESGLLVTAVLNEYVDAFLPTVKKYMVVNGMDPMQLPNMTEGFNFKPLLISYNGNLELTKGNLRNLKSLKRVGDILVSYGSAILTSKGNFGVTDLKFNYNYLAQIMGIGPTGGVSGSVSKVNMFVDIVVDFNTNQMKIRDFYMHDIGEITVILTGNPLTDPLSNVIIKVITTLSKNDIFNYVKQNMKKSLQENIDQINSSKGGAKGFLIGIDV